MKVRKINPADITTKDLVEILSDISTETIFDVLRERITLNETDTTLLPRHIVREIDNQNIRNLEIFLRQTLDEELGLEYNQETGKVEITYNGRHSRYVNVEGDSYIAALRDIMLAIY